jgi:simple sugar transport system permease protein
MSEFIKSLLELNWVSMLAQTLSTAVPIVLAALGGIMAERSGVINIALEGIMLFAAYVAFAIGLLADSTLIGLIAGVAFGGLLALFHGVLSIKYKVNQTISGTVMNIFAAGITGYLFRQFPTDKSVSTFTQWNVPVLSQIPVIGEVFFQQQPITYITLLLIVIVHFVLFRTSWGLRTRAIGEHPRAADTVGVNVNRMRYINVIISGLLAGLGGAWLIAEGVGSFTPNMTTGRGFMGLAAMIFGSWTPLGAFLASLLFTIPAAIQVKLQLIGVPIPYQFLGMAPYILTIIALASAVRRVSPPSALGKPYSTGSH